MQVFLREMWKEGSYKPHDAINRADITTILAGTQDILYLLLEDGPCFAILYRSVTFHLAPKPT